MSHFVTPPPLPTVISDLNKNFFLMMVSSLGIVAGLSWNEAIKTLFEKNGPFHQVKSMGVWVAALGITAIAYFATALFSRMYPNEQAPAKQTPIRV